jgi:3'-phosphoadenosine 5'-phosphosulfate sulfotransferase (PAPS reductase)/FAD synthetase|nr:MAG TPA: phosphoadenosine-phosphosulfate reductase [Caudoviricetes sp.]
MTFCLFEEDYNKVCSSVTCESWETCTRKGKKEFIKKREEDLELTARPKHTDGELKIMQSFSLETKIQMTKQRIRDWYEAYNGLVYVSFSGGKDSTVLKHIVDNMYSDVPSVFVNTGLEYPEIQKFAKSQKNVITVTPAMRFDEVIKMYGYPVISKEVSKRVKEYHNAEKKRQVEESTAYKEFNGLRKNKDSNTSAYNKEKWSYLLESDFKISDMCCDIMKKKPAKRYEKETGRKPIIATLANESRARKTRWKQEGCNAFNAKRPVSTPLAFWTEQDILHYIKEYNVPYCSVYGDIQIKNDDEQLDGQIAIQDYLGNYRSGDILVTTGCDRTGCIFCMFGCHLEQSPNRFERLKETHPRQYDYCINGGEEANGNWQPNKKGLGLGKVLDYIGVKY